MKTSSTRKLFWQVVLVWGGILALLGLLVWNPRLPARATPTPDPSEATTPYPTLPPALPAQGDVYDAYRQPRPVHTPFADLSEARMTDLITRFDMDFWCPAAMFPLRCTKFYSEEERIVGRIELESVAHIVTGLRAQIRDEDGERLSAEANLQFGRDVLGNLHYDSDPDGVLVWAEQALPAVIETGQRQSYRTQDTEYVLEMVDGGLTIRLLDLTAPTLPAPPDDAMPTITPWPSDVPTHTPIPMTAPPTPDRGQ